MCIRDSGNIGTENNNLSDGGITSQGFIPTVGYWMYDVSSFSQDISEINFTASDSIYVSYNSQNSFLISANDNGIANGNMNIILTSGELFYTPNTLTFDGNLNLPENLMDLGLIENLNFTGVIIYDLNADNGEVMYVQDDNLTNTIDVQGTEIPIELSYEIFTIKNNFHNTLYLNEVNYENVFEGKLDLSISVNGTFSVFGFSQNIEILEQQSIITINYYYAQEIGLIRAESSQGFELSSDLMNLINIPFDLPTSLNTQVVEELKDYSVE